MMMKYVFSCGMIFSCLLAVIACSETSGLTKSDVLGYWEVVSASRDGQTTETLNGARFIIEETDFTTDMTGEEVSQAYVLNEDKIITQDGVEYTVKNVQNDSLNLGFVIRDMKFTVILNKKDKNQ